MYVYTKRTIASYLHFLRKKFMEYFVLDYQIQTNLREFLFAIALSSNRDIETFCLNELKMSWNVIDINIDKLTREQQFDGRNSSLCFLLSRVIKF